MNLAKTIIQKKALSSNNLSLNLFLFNGNKYIKISNKNKACYFLLSNVIVKLHDSLDVSNKDFSFKYYDYNEKLVADRIQFFYKYISQFQKVYRKKLIVKGLGYKINVLKSENKNSNNINLEFKIGYSHTKNILLPKKVNDYFLNKNSISLESFNLAWLGSFITRLKNFRKPDIYKGKGLHIKGQKILILKPIKKK